MLALVSPYSGEPKVSYVSVLSLVLLNKYMPIWLPTFYPFGVAVRGKATFEMLALVIPYSENTMR